MPSSDRLNELADSIQQGLDNGWFRVQDMQEAILEMHRVLKEEK